MASPLFLELGSIIQIEASKNSNLHNNIYYIDYIDNDKIKIVGPKNTETLTLSNGSLDDESIENIIILSKPEKKDMLVLKNFCLHLGLKFTLEEIYLLYCLVKLQI